MVNRLVALEAGMQWACCAVDAVGVSLCGRYFFGVVLTTGQRDVDVTQPHGTVPAPLHPPLHAVFAILSVPEVYIFYSPAHGWPCVRVMAVTSTHECRMYYRRTNRWDILQQNQTPIHRKTQDRLAAVENPKKHQKPRPNAQKPADGRKDSATHPTPCWQRQCHPRPSNTAQENRHHADRGDIILVHPVNVIIARCEIDVAVDNPRVLNDTGAIGLLREEMRSAGNSTRVDHGVWHAGSVATYVHRLKYMLAHIRRWRPR
jgi:hypothetical protein